LHQAAHPVTALRPVLTAAQLASLTAAAGAVHVGDELLAYIAAIVEATRKDARIRLGVSPRGALALMRAAQALALLDGRDFVEPANVKALVVPVLAHRIILNADHERGERAAERVVSEVAARVPPPVR
jgi:MoxR-like ATPase